MLLMWWLFYRKSISIILYQIVFNEKKIDHPVNLSKEFLSINFFFYLNLNFFSGTSLDSEVIICFLKICLNFHSKRRNPADHHSYIACNGMERLSQQISACNDKLSLLYIMKKLHHYMPIIHIGQFRCSIHSYT